MSTNNENEVDLEQLLPHLCDIKNVDLRSKVKAVWVKLWKEGEYENIEEPTWVAEWKNQIDFPNITHTNQVTECAIAMAEVITKNFRVEVNLDYLIAGALLHDVDKLVSHHGSKPTKIGKMLPHAFYSAHTALNLGLPIEVIHMIITHTAFSLVPPKSIEALILHYADYCMADALLMSRGLDFLWSAVPPKYVREPEIGKSPKLT